MWNLVLNVLGFWQKEKLIIDKSWKNDKKCQMSILYSSKSVKILKKLYHIGTISTYNDKKTFGENVKSMG